MNKKIDVEVVIGGKPYTLSGYESSDYLQRIAMHINGKIAEFRAQEGYARLETELKNVLLAINLSDDYQKAQNTIRELKQDNEDMEKEVERYRAVTAGQLQTVAQTAFDKANGVVLKIVSSE